MMNSIKKILVVGTFALTAMFVTISDAEAAKLEDGKVVVEKGDTLYKVSKTFNVTVEEMKKVNELTNDKIKVGQELILPNETFKGKIKYSGLADNHSVEFYNSTTKEYFVVQVTSEQVKKIKKVKNFKNITVQKGTMKMVSFK